MLTEHLGLRIAPSTYYEHAARPVQQRPAGRRDAALLEQIRRVHSENNHGTYGARKVWLQLNREGITVARCTVERLMRGAGLVGVRRGKTKRTTIADPAAQRAADLVQRRFAALVPDRWWGADITYVSTWSGWVYVALVTDAYARRILGWRVAITMNTQLVLDALEQAIWTRERSGQSLEHVVAHSDRGSQYTSIRYSKRLAEVGIAASVGSVGDSYDNALAESVNSLYKAEVIRHRGPRRSIDAVEFATAEWIDWYNHRRLHEYCGDIPPAELEDAFYAHHQAQQPAGLTV